MHRLNGWIGGGFDYSESRLGNTIKNIIGSQKCGSILEWSVEVKLRAPRGLRAVVMVVGW